MPAFRERTVQMIELKQRVKKEVRVIKFVVEAVSKTVQEAGGFIFEMGWPGVAFGKMLLEIPGKQNNRHTIDFLKKYRYLSFTNTPVWML